jgi:uncharacterized membrane protein YeiH
VSTSITNNNCVVRRPAVWLGVSTLSAFGLIEAQYIGESGQNLIYLTTLVIVCVRMLAFHQHESPPGVPLTPFLTIRRCDWNFT